MDAAYTVSSPSSRPPTLGGLMLLIGFILMGGVLSTLLLFGGLMLADGVSFTAIQAQIQQLATRPQTVANGWYRLMVLQAINHLGSFLLPSLAYWYWIERQQWSRFNRRSLATVAGFPLIVALIVVFFMPFDGLIIEWNQHLHLPDTLAPVERWIRAKEASLESVTKFLTTFASPLQLVVALVVIAVIPAIGEETLFRGILQRNLAIWTGNVHAGIWLAAFFFSAIHVQFLGFFPRMLLGALFGYLYLWSGNLWVAILAHFVNNGVTVGMVYLHQQQLIPIDIERTESVPVLGALIAGALTAGLLVYFYRTNHDQPGG